MASLILVSVTVGVEGPVRPRQLWERILHLVATVFFSGTVAASLPFLTVFFPSKPNILYLSNAGIAGSSASGCIYVYMHFLCFAVQGKRRIATVRSPCKYN